MSLSSAKTTKILYLFAYNLRLHLHNSVRKENDYPRILSRILRLGPVFLFIRRACTCMCLGVWYVYIVCAYALNGIDIEVILRIIIHGGSDCSGGGLRCSRWLLLFQGFLLGSIIVFNLEWKIWNIRYVTSYKRIYLKII